MKHLTVAAIMICGCAAVCGQDTDADSPRREPQPQIRYELGADSLTQDGVPQGRLEGPHLFHSSIIEDTVRKYWVYVPSQYDPQQPACVLVFQDGARATNPNGVLRIQNVLDNLIAKQQIPVTIGIFITPGQRGDEFPDSIGTGNPNNRDREYDVLDDVYARFIVDEMLPEVGKKYNLTDDPAGRTIGGSSSGAICAFTVAWHKPEQFRNVVSLIGSYTNIHGGHVYPDLVREADAKPIRIFLQDGINDLRNPQNPDRDWYLQNQKMQVALKEKGYDMAFVLGEGGHSDDHGGAILPLMLRWVWRDYPGVKSPQSDLVAEAKAVQPARTDPFPGFDAQATVDPSGTYRWERRFGRPNSPVSVTTLRIQSEDGRISGTYETRRGDADPEVTEILNAELHGNKLIFDVQRSFGDRTFTSSHVGIISDKGINGWQLMSFNGSPRDFRWEASRVDSDE
jgi:enterochelin esterase family protein